MRQNNNFARVADFFRTFLCPHGTTATCKCLISRSMEDVDKSRRNFLSVSELGHSSIQFLKSSLAFDKISELE